MPSDIDLLIDKDGQLIFLYDDELAVALSELGVPVTRRASHVEPDPDHPGMWLADMTPATETTTMLGPFDTRRQALQAEVEYLKKFLMST